MPETTIRPAFEAQKLAVDLIDQHHEHLQEARILWLFTTSKRTRGGHVTLGTAARSSPLQRFLSSGNESVQTGHDYIVQIDEGRWKRALATQRAALIDHLCCRMVQREVANKRTGEITKTWGTIGPDIEEFSDVILRHGVWLPEQQVMARAMREQGNTLKLKLPDLQDEPSDEPPAPKERGAERITTVEPDGIVVSTEQTGDAAASEHARKNAETAERPAGTNGHIQPEDMSDGELVQSLARDLPDPPPDEHAPGWQGQTGIGASEHEQRRRRRRQERSSESVPSA